MQIILSLIILSFLISFIYLLVKYILGYKNNKFLYKSSLKSIKSLSFSMVLLILFYGFSFGFVFGSTTANSTYKDQLETQNMENNAHLFYQNNTQLKNGIYDDRNDQYLTEDYWNLIFDNIATTDYEYLPTYDWEDFTEMLVPDGYYRDELDENNELLYEPIYGEELEMTPFAWYKYDSRIYYTLLVWDFLYEESSINEEFYYRYTAVSQLNGRPKSSSSYLDYREFNFISLTDYNPETNEYYETWDEMVTSSSILQKTTTSNSYSQKDPEFYYVADYNFTEFYDGYNENDLLAYNNHCYDSEGNIENGSNACYDANQQEDINDLVIEVAVSQKFAEENNIVLGEEVELLFDSSTYNEVLTFLPIAFYEDAYSSGDSKYSGSILVNSLDFNWMNMGYETYSKYNARSALLFQTEEFSKTNKVSDHTSSTRYEELTQTELFKIIDEWNNAVSQSLLSGFEEDELTQADINNYYKYFYFSLSVNSKKETNSLSYYDSNLDGYFVFYVTYIFNILITILIFMVVIFMVYSIIGKRIKDEYKQFGVLKSMGYKTSAISIAFLTFPIILLILSNAFALSIMMIFFNLQMSKLTSSFYVNINTFYFPTLLLLVFLTFAIVLLFSYIKIRRSLSKPELILLGGATIYSPGFIFKNAAKIGDKFKRFETSYAFKNIFKSLSKSTVVLFATFFSLFLIGVSLTLTSFIKINTDENFGGVKFDYYFIVDSNENEDKFDYQTEWIDYRAYTDFGSTEEEAMINAFILGDYNFSKEALGVFNPNLSFETNYINVTNSIMDYLLTNPIIERNDLERDEVTNKYDMFDYSYISSSSSLDFFKIYTLLYIQYIEEDPTLSMGDSFDLDNGFYYNGVQYEQITFHNLNDRIFRSATNSLIFGSDFFNVSNIISIDLSNVTRLDIIIWLANNAGSFNLLEYYPTINYGRTLYNPEITTTTYYEQGAISSSENSRSDSIWLQTLVTDNLNDFDDFWNLNNKRGESVGKALENEIPNNLYIPVAIDEGTEKHFDVKVDDFIYLSYYDSNGELIYIPLKVVDIYEKADYGIITSQEYVESYFGSQVQQNAVLSHDSNVLSNQQLYSFSNESFNRAAFLDNDFYLIDDKSIGIIQPPDYGFRDISHASVFKVSLPLLELIVEHIYKKIATGILLASSVILIIPMFMILIAIKEIIDDNIVEVSMLKSMGYSTWDTSRLILSSSIVVIVFAFFILVPAMLLVGWGLNLLIIYFIGIDLTFKLLWWHWVILVGILLLIMALLYLVSYYFYHKLKSKTILMNIS